jgi:hypothetical protein
MTFVFFESRARATLSIATAVRIAWPQVKASTAAYFSSGQVWIEMCDSASRAKAVTPTGVNLWDEY